MLTVLTALVSQKMQPEVESVDRDPGIVTLLSTIARSVYRGLASAVAALPASYQQANEAEVFSAASAWPYDHRSH